MAARKKTTRAGARSKTKHQDFMDKLKQFVRTEGVSYLKDKNISSVGIGYKIKDNKTTNEISIQFTVGSKRSTPEAFKDLGTKEIPKSFTIDGVEVPTDVLERTYERSFRIVAESSGGPRKTRIDPIVPGISIANTKETAGTLGTVVFDRNDGTPYVLSNWHVLHGPCGAIGDEIVQPGPYDDNRIQFNHSGVLIRSYLGVAGDCAIASIENRDFDKSILGIGTVAEQLGEPELGDKVIKSGRTTGVTHGIVNRIDTIVKIFYGGSCGEQEIGGFEIGPDDDNLPEDGEISKGGDSGALWMFKDQQGNPTTVMAGLHFAGEGGGDPNEHAIACYPRSVFEKLEITLTPPGEERAVAGAGYSPEFLGTRVNLPALLAAPRREAFELDGSEIIPYTHFSLALNKSRRLSFWVAWNIDGGRMKKISRKGCKFVFDPRIPDEFQAGDDVYRSNPLDRGHIARRADLTWGTDAEARKANDDSFYFTNITPQMETFNQSARAGLWGELENAVFDEVDVENLRVSVFGGPVFADDDRVYRGLPIPREFFKVLAYVEEGELKAKAFLLTQNLDNLERLDLDEFKVYQVTLGEIEQRCVFRFPNNLKSADAFAEHLERLPETVSKRRPLDSLTNIVW